ncbi:MAG: hypothetical protein IJR46_08595 [Neisseriaceae bacterium]|nr:hypothetical protein [Neisseriaceae bacterium]
MCFQVFRQPENKTCHCERAVRLRVAISQLRRTDFSGSLNIYFVFQFFNLLWYASKQAC